MRSRQESEFFTFHGNNSPDIVLSKRELKLTSTSVPQAQWGPVQLVCLIFMTRIEAENGQIFEKGNMHVRDDDKSKYL